MREPDEYRQPTEIQLVLVPVIIEAVASIVFIACSLLLVVIYASIRMPL